MNKQATASQAVRIIPQEETAVSPITRDEQLRKKVQAVREYYLKRSCSEEEFQYRLSKVLCQVERTDTGNAIRLHARYGHHFRFIPEANKFFTYLDREGRYQLDTEFHVMAYAKKTAAYIDMERDCVSPPTDEDGNPLMLPILAPGEKPTAEQQAILDRFAAYESQKKALDRWGEQSRSKTRLQAMIELVKDEPDTTIAKARFDADNYLLNCKNGVLDLKTGRLLTHKREYLMMKLANTDILPGAQCPKWIAFHEKITLGRHGIMTYLQKLAGIGLCGLQLEDMFNIFHGPGSNGKGVWKEVIRDIYGDYVGVATENMFMERSNDAGDFEMAGLDGLRFLFKDETKQGRRLNETLVKSATGRDPIRACFKFQDYFTFLPRFTIVLSTNHKPIITGTDNGIWRRVKLIPWDHNFDTDPEKRAKEDVLDDFRTEYPGILWWAYQGLHMALDDLEKYGSLQVPDEIKAATQQYREQSDVIGAFIAEHCIVAPGERVAKGEIYKVYRDYMEEAGSHPLNKSNFGEELLKRGFEEHNARPLGRQWLGIRLRTEKDPVVEPVAPANDTEII